MPQRLPDFTLMLDMWVIFVNISPVIGPVIHEERKAPA
jgi:hypothetical protein